MIPRIPQDPENAEPVPYRKDDGNCSSCMFWTPYPPKDAIAGPRHRCPLKNPAYPMLHPNDLAKLACMADRPGWIDDGDGVRYEPRRVYGNEED